MASHFSSIGFSVGTPEAFVQLARQVSSQATAVVVRGGRYLRWAGASGEELWLQLDSGDDLIGMNPHFSGPARVRVGILERISRPGATQLDGGFDAWASPPSDDPTDGCYPFAFDLPDASVYSDLEFPSVAEAQIAAFAHEVSFFESEAAYRSGRQGRLLAPKAFVPTGMFRRSNESSEAPAAEAVFTGQVVRASVLTNSLTRRPFYWALVDTFGGQYDVVIDPQLLSREPAAGGLLMGSFWLSGRLMSHSKKKGWLGRLRR